MESDIRQLRQWRPVFGRSPLVIMVEGYLDNDDVRKVWRSSVIDYAETPRILVTKTGKKYELIGSIASKICIEKGYPITVLNDFAVGFPNNWEDILFDVYDQITQPQGNRSIDYDLDLATPQPKNLNSKSLVPSKGSQDTTKTSRSGRVIKKPLANWANQSIVYDIHGNPIEARNVSTLTRTSKNVNQKLEDVCTRLSIETPKTSEVQERSIIDKPIPKKPPPKKASQKSLVIYGSSDDEYDSIDEEPLEVTDVFTPIVPSRKCVSKIRQRQLHFLESSPEDKIEREEKRERRKRHKASHHHQHNVPSKKGRTHATGLLKLRREARPNSAASENHPLVEFPESEASFDMNADDHENEVPKLKKWTAKEKQNFLTILKRLNPVKDVDWIQVQNFKIDVYRTIEELQEKAIELGWRPSGVPNRTFNGKSSNIANRSMEQVTARPGTIAHIVQLEKANQQLLKEKHSHQSAVARDVSEMFAHSKKPVEWDESFVLGSNTPENPKRYRRGFIPTMGQPRMDVSTLNDSTISDLDNQSANSSIFVQDEAARLREQTNGLRALKQAKTRTTRRVNGNNQSTFTETTTTTTYSFTMPPPPLRPQRPIFASTLEEELEESDEEEEEDEFEEEL